MIFTHEASIPLAASDIHLDEWLFNLSESDYKACARGHRAVGTIGGLHFEGMVNVESMAGALIIQHYKTDLLEANHVRLSSERSRAYLMHLLPFHLQVSWEMQVSSVSAHEARLRCTIDVRNPLWVRFIGVFNATNYWIRRHLIEETQGFARDLSRKGTHHVAGEGEVISTGKSHPTLSEPAAGKMRSAFVGTSESRPEAVGYPTVRNNALGNISEGVVAKGGMN